MKRYMLETSDYFLDADYIYDNLEEAKIEAARRNKHYKNKYYYVVSTYNNGGTTKRED